MFIVIDANRKDLTIEELKDLLADISATQNKTLERFCIELREFIVNFNKIPSLPRDKVHFKDFSIDDLIYLIESCKKFSVIDSPEPEEKDSFVVDSSNILDEFKFSAILAAEIQKIITRKYLPSTGMIKKHKGDQL
jgi:hypothetical protein